MRVTVLLGLLAAFSSQDIRFRERVDVERVVVDVRAVDASGRPVLGLTPQDFQVKVDGTHVDVESAFWVSADAPPPVTGGPPSLETAAPGRLIVFFFQKDFESSRLKGLLLMMRKAGKLIRGLGPQDRVAVLSFDTHLKLWLDFTLDREALQRVLDHSILFENRPAAVADGSPAMAAHFDVERGRDASSPEQALLVTAEALKEVPGAKSLVLIGHGFGRLSPGVGVVLDQAYGEAQRALTEARVTVFSLDVTDADFHSLEFGLQQVASDTGGFFARTHNFPAQALARLEYALSGHYVLTFAKPPLPPGEHALDIRLVGRKGSVLAKRSYRGS